ncbi:hypothetical protein HUS23_01505 [Ectothiorhodospiraceae bacterium 2226]|nr:hypothetical protein HUS23_01505 [Ectothiorhodospiraceae bacterium 2226]
MNGVKFELGVILLVAPLVWLVGGRLVPGPAEHLALLAAFGGGAALWLIWRTRRAMRRALARGAAGQGHGTQ